MEDQVTRVVLKVVDCFDEAVVNRHGDKILMNSDFELRSARVTWESTCDLHG